jgi:hypothetical protein
MVSVEAVVVPHITLRPSKWYRRSQIVESRPEGAQVRRQVIATLRRVDDLRERGQLQRLLRSGARFAAKA